MDPTGGYQDYAFVADLYDHVVPYRGRPDIAFYVEAAEVSDGPVLEVGCGTGRVLIPTARAGIEIVGLDLSTNMLEICRRRLQNEPEEVQARAQLIEADMRAGGTDIGMQRNHSMAAMFFSGKPDITDNTDQPSAGDQHPVDLPPDRF